MTDPVKAAQKKADDWNRDNEIGQTVAYRDDTRMQTRHTESRAFESGGVARITLAGIRGTVPLNRIKAIREPAN